MLGVQRRISADRQTIIALRATHTAHRVACDVAYPELKAAKDEGAGVFGERRIIDPLDVLPYSTDRRSRRLHELLVAFAIIATLVAIFVLCLEYFERR